MLDDLVVLEAKDVEADLGAEEVVVGLREHEVAVGEDAHRVHPRRALGQLGQHRAEARQAIGLAQVVLDELVGVDDHDRTGLAGLDRLQEGDDLGLVSGGGGTSGWLAGASAEDADRREGGTEVRASRGLHGPQSARDRCSAPLARS